jgi:alkylated DNA repair protein (DNA oxidative demethylase)
MTSLPLFSHQSTPNERLSAGAALLHGYALPQEAELLADIARIAAASPFRHMTTPGGFEMSVAMTNCGPLGWTSDRRGYRYSPVDPLHGAPWPAMPVSFANLAANAAVAAGYPHFRPDACLINRYAPGTRLSLHQDKDERDFSQPIVSVSLGLPATFLFGGLQRGEKPLRLPLQHGDVVVWGGEDRLRFHGVLPLREGQHPQLGNVRINLTFRKAG